MATTRKDETYNAGDRYMTEREFRQANGMTVLSLTLLDRFTWLYGCPILDQGLADGKRVYRWGAPQVGERFRENRARLNAALKALRLNGRRQDGVSRDVLLGKGTYAELLHPLVLEARDLQDEVCATLLGSAEPMRRFRRDIGVTLARTRETTEKTLYKQLKHNDYEKREI